MNSCCQHHATKSDWFDFAACCRQQNLPSKMLESRYFAKATLKHFHAICYKHIFLAIAPENRPVSPKRNNFQHYTHTRYHKVWKFIENFNFWLIHLTKCLHHIEIKWFAKQIYYFIKKFSYCFILFRCSKNNFGPLMRMLPYSPDLHQSLYQAY